MAQIDKPWIDYSHELKLNANPWVRFLWRGLGLLCVALGVLGAFLPLLPTTVFLLLATFFFARSSPRLYNWIMNHPLCGPFIRDWRAGLGIPLSAKILAVTMIVLGIGISIWIVPLMWVRYLLVCIGLSVSTYLITRPTKKPAGQ